MPLEPDAALTGSVPAEPGGGGIELFYRRLGDAPEALIAPSASWLGWDLDALGRNRSWISYDLRGRGRSSAVHSEGVLGFQHDLGDLERLRSHLGLESMALLGWSYHGLLAARYALERPGRVDRLILVGSSAPRRSPHFEDFLDRFARRLRPEGLARMEELRRKGTKTDDPLKWCRFVHRLFLEAYVQDASCLASMKSEPCVEPNLDPDRVNNQGRRVLELMGPFDWREEFTQLSVPTLILHGTEDPVSMRGSEEWEECLPAGKLVRLEGVGHMPWLEAPRVFFPIVEEFLSSGTNKR